MREARAFWLREPGVGRDPRRRAARAARPDDVVVRTLRSAVSRGTESLVFGGRVPPSQYDAMRAPFQDGDFPGPVKYGYLNVGRVEEGPADLRRPRRSSACIRTRRRTSSRRGGRPCAGRRTRGPRRAGRHRRDRGQRAVGRAAPARRPRGGGRRRRPRAAASRGWRRAVPGTRGDAGRRRSVPRRRWPPRSAWTSRCRTRPPAARPRRPHERHVGRPAALPRPARAGGDGARAQLVRRRADDRSRSAAASTPVGSPCGRARWAAWRPRAGTVARRRSASPWRSTCSATTPSTAC